MTANTADVALLDGSFAPDAALRDFVAAYPGSGAVASFTGLVRPDGDVTALELSHYGPLTLSGFEQLAWAALKRWPLDGVLIRHRVGIVVPGEPIVLVAAAARHRRAALQAIDYTMDHLKSAAWLWKRERRGDRWQWVEPRAQDHADLARWQVES